MTDERLNSSLRYFNDNISDQEKKRLIKDFTRLAIYTEANRKELSKELILQQVFKKEHSRAFLAVFHYGQNRLRNLFGMELTQATIRDKSVQSAMKLKDAYILRSIPQMINDEKNLWIDSEENWMPLLCIILSLILGSGRSIPFESLKEFLGKMEVDLEAKSEEFGDMKELLSLWFKQGYLVKIAAQPQTPEYIVWGPRSKILFNEEKIANFMVKMFGDEISLAKQKQLKSGILSSE